ncbi:hypothetical protein QNJ24_00050 [Macrococcus caseolyticus]|uniref:hypothetical protein n=1 Tax=Macrococcoides caseolyticum TaxID=69966 RepID=UPI0024BC82B7|nr:hypothetical protein [Macrococcus caseolyticus]MDJ1154472.1 hypothetical protein [Macrococcus caseolyticus]
MKLIIATSTALLAISYIITLVSEHLAPFETAGLFIVLSCLSLLLVINSEFVESDK